MKKIPLSRSELMRGGGSVSNMSRADPLEFCMAAAVELDMLAEQVKARGVLIQEVQNSKNSTLSKTKTIHGHNMAVESLKRRAAHVRSESAKLSSIQYLFMKRAKSILDTDTYRMLRDMAAVDADEIRSSLAIEHDEAAA